MRLFSWIMIVSLVVSAAVATAQTYPEPRDAIVNDYADMLPDETEARITEVLTDLADDTGAQATIVTLSSVQFYAQDLGIPEYATGLFNAWGVGDADAGDGILLIVFRDDKELRLQLGDGYDADAKARAEEVVTDTIIPSFRDDAFAAGIEAGATGIADHVVRNTQATVESEPAEGGSGNALYYIGGAVVAAIAAIIGLNKRAAAKLAATPCPNCGVAGQLSKGNTTITEATEIAEGQGEKTLTCAACGHVEREIYTIAKVQPKSDETFKGGTTKGEGATGKW